MKPATKSLNLPKPIAAYFTGDKGDGEAVSRCFTENAVVMDEGLFAVLWEEPTLRRTFGGDYETYCGRVGRWWPRF